ncbi:NmrA family NAD(P)-binding protein [Myxococcus sp. K15C18031901]|uniref:NmrA family NAD(P)-binding protein n=1 Tax=Myxococcus dinghuensis TaxID=2906761 RepID=UPI0020A701C1|nr:NmrA family NAD(P)-binding protein [Myxococcus dinghuensis]MCP3098509.1 NmrA family NAD(P)-binding protein [Myxococcus dinghuensis]
MSIVINTPNGNIGRPLVRHLLAGGARVTLISRSADKVADLVKAGAKLVEGSTDDAAVLDAAFAGATAVFWLTPPAARPDFFAWSEGAARLAARKARAHGVRRAVVLSSIGAQNGRGTGPVGGLLAVEEAFKAELADVTILRPGYFMENLLREVPSLASADSLFMPLQADRKTPFVAVADIARKAADVLLDGAWKGHRIVGIHGAADVTYTEVAAILSEALGRPVRYVQVGMDDTRKALVGYGMPGFMVDLFTEMFGAYNDGRMSPAESRSAETTTATALATWAREVLKPAVDQARASAA